MKPVNIANTAVADLAKVSHSGKLQRLCSILESDADEISLDQDKQEAEFDEASAVPLPDDED